MVGGSHVTAFGEEKPLNVELMFFMVWYKAPIKTAFSLSK